MTTPTTETTDTAETPVRPDAPRQPPAAPAPVVAPAAAPAPVAAPAAAIPAILVALALLGLGVVGVRDALAAAGALTGPLWTVSAAGAISGSTPTLWVLVGGIVAVLLGVWAIVRAVRPRAVRGLRIDARSSVWMTPRDAARLSLAAATRVPGVTGATATANRRRLVVTATGEQAGADLGAAVGAAAESALSGLEHAPRVRVRTRAPKVLAASGDGSRS
ncbi:MAG: DUF6286 domain-containing protein [Lapillicoccus sp.]